MHHKTVEDPRRILAAFYRAAIMNALQFVTPCFFKRHQVILASALDCPTQGTNFRGFLDGYHDLQWHLDRSHRCVSVDFQVDTVGRRGRTRQSILLGWAHYEAESRSGEQFSDIAPRQMVRHKSLIAR